MEQKLTTAETPPPSYSSIEKSPIDPAHHPLPSAPPPPPYTLPTQPDAASPVYIVHDAPDAYQHPQPVESFAGHIVFACIVLWCCNWLFGLVAFFVAIMASNNARSHPAQARRLGNASVVIAVTGVIVSIIVAAIVMGVVLNRRYTYYSTYAPN